MASAVAACGGSSDRASKPAVAMTTVATVPLTAQQLRAALLDPNRWGSGWTDIQGGPKVLTTGMGKVADIASQDCWTALYPGIGTGSQTAVTDVVFDNSSAGDVATQGVYQFAAGDAAAMLAALSKKVDGCSDFAHTDTSGTYTLQAHEEPVPALGDQAIEITVRSDGPSTKDTGVDLAVRYNDVVVLVVYDSGVPGRTLAYDLTAKAEAIASGLGLRGGSPAPVTRPSR
jgi:hypothetical protein